MYLLAVKYYLPISQVLIEEVVKFVEVVSLMGPLLVSQQSWRHLGYKWKDHIACKNDFWKWIQILSVPSLSLSSFSWSLVQLPLCHWSTLLRGPSWKSPNIWYQSFDPDPPKLLFQISIDWLSSQRSGFYNQTHMFFPIDWLIRIINQSCCSNRFGIFFFNRGNLWKHSW